MRRHFASFLIVMLCGWLLEASLLSLEAQAASITKVKGAQVIVEFDDGEELPSSGAQFFAVEDGKRKALIQIVRIKDRRASGRVAKGRAKEGMLLQARGGTSAASSQTADASEYDDATASEAQRKSPRGSNTSKKSARSKSVMKAMDTTYGVLLGFGMDSQSVTPTGTATVAMSGSGFSAKGFIDIPISSSVGLLGRGGAEQFNVKKDAFKTEIMYATIDLLLRYTFSDGGFAPFLLGGMGIHFPLSKTSNILDVNRISSTTVFFAGLGANMAMGSSSYFQLTAEYGLFPPSNEVSTNFIAIRGGLGFQY
jgi:hypothetical protein